MEVEKWSVHQMIVQGYRKERMINKVIGSGIKLFGMEKRSSYVILFNSRR